MVVERERFKGWNSFVAGVELSKIDARGNTVDVEYAHALRYTRDKAIRSVRSACYLHTSPSVSVIGMP